MDLGSDGVHRTSIMVLDWGAYPFTLDLADSLAGLGAHDVSYVYCESVALPNVAAAATQSRQAGLINLRLRRSFVKYGPRRIVSELELALRSYRTVVHASPDVVVLVNNPPLAQLAICLAALRTRAQFVHWVQDLYGVGVAELTGGVTRPSLKRAAGGTVEAVERFVMRRADAVVAISEPFATYLTDRVGVDRARILVQPNWADCQVVTPSAADGPASVFGMDERVFLYAGTIGLKHDVDLLDELAVRLRPQGGRLVVVSEGPGAEALRRHGNATVLPFQSTESHAIMLASAHVLVAVLNASAGRFSVPSKINAYLCAGRPVLASIPSGNPAAELIDRAGMPRAEPDDRIAFLEAADGLVSATLEELDAIGARGRNLALEIFDLDSISRRMAVHMAVHDRRVTRRSALLVQMSLGQYRAHFLQELVRRRPDLKIIVGPRFFDGKVRTQPDVLDVPVRMVRNHFLFGERFVVQPSAILPAIRAGVGGCGIEPPGAQHLGGLGRPPPVGPTERGVGSSLVENWSGVAIEQGAEAPDEAG